MSYTVEPIGVLHTCFTDKFGIPRQPGLVTKAEGIIRLNNDYKLRRALHRLEEFSHLWVLFWFHANHSKGWKSAVRPPRLGGKSRVGVLATRSPHRPNPIGLSVVQILKIDTEAKAGPEIWVSGVDVLDQTPVIDIKPYIAYADSHPGASQGWADSSRAQTAVRFDPSVIESIEKLEDSLETQGLKELIEEVVSQDPRPASQKAKYPIDDARGFNREFLVEIGGADIRWQITETGFVVTHVGEKRTRKTERG